MAATLVLLLLLEASVRIVYYIRNSHVEYVPLVYTVRNFGLLPPWQDQLRILEPDDVLMWKGRPHAQVKYVDVFGPVHREEDRISLLRRFNPQLPDWLKGNPVWEVSLNSEGFRADELPTTRQPGTIRILCLGDSWTFGANVNRDQSYPERMKTLLQAEYPPARIEVINLGMLAYSSYQGLQLLKTRALALKPDIVILGYAMNDSVIAGYRDKEQAQVKPQHFKLKRFLTENLESYKLLWYLAQVRRFETKSMSDYLKAIVDPSEKLSTYEGWSSTESLEVADYEKYEAKTRVSPKDYEQNLRQMIALIRQQGALPLLLDNELRPGSPYQSVLQKLSAEEAVPLVDSSAIITQAKRQAEKELEERLSLHPSAPAVESQGNREVEVVFRLYTGEQPVPQAIYITGPFPQLGDATPNQVQMYDDGTHGDERAGDHVWSYTAKFAPGMKLFYVYTNSGARGQWENLDVPKIRSVVVPGSSVERAYLPVETFGRIYMQSDGWHTNATGYDLIARAIADTLKQSGQLNSRMR